jgi:hypothetical protein
LVIQGEIKKKPARRYFSIKGGGEGGKMRKLSILVVN